MVNTISYERIDPVALAHRAITDAAIDLEEIVVSAQTVREALSLRCVAKQLEYLLQHVTDVAGRKADALSEASDIRRI